MLSAAPTSGVTYNGRTEGRSRRDADHDQQQLTVTVVDEGAPGANGAPGQERP
jgi:hypothetical protein